MFRLRNIGQSLYICFGQEFQYTGKKIKYYMENKIIDRFVKVRYIHYLGYTVSTTHNYCIMVRFDFLYPFMYVNGYDSYCIAIYDTMDILMEEVYNILFKVYRYCGVSREELLLWVMSKIDFDKAWDKNMYHSLRGNFICEKN